MRNEIRLGIIAVAIAVVVILTLKIVLNDGIQIASAQSKHSPGPPQSKHSPGSPQLLPPQANLQDNQRITRLGLSTDLEGTLFSKGKQLTTICHASLGNPANRHTIQVPNNELPAHLAHKDTIGACDAKDAGKGKQVDNNNNKADNNREIIKQVDNSQVPTQMDNNKKVIKQLEQQVDNNKKVIKQLEQQVDNNHNQANKDNNNKEVIRHVDNNKRIIK